MLVPILKQGAHLVASIHETVTDSELLALQNELLAKIGCYRSQGVLIDVSGLEVLDSFATRTMRTIAQMLKLRGAETVVIGVQPDVALAMVQLGLTLKGVTTALDLDEGLAVLAQRGVAR